MPKRKPRRSPAWCRDKGGLPGCPGAEAEERMAVETQKLLERLTRSQDVHERKVALPNAPVPMVSVLMPRLRRRRKAVCPPPA